MLIASRVVEGFGSAMIFGTGIAILTQAFPAKERGQVLGINVAIVYLGSSIGPFLGGIITQHSGWRVIYAAIMIYALVAALLAQRSLKEEWRCEDSGHFDIAGTVLYGMMLFALIFGLSLIPDMSGAYLLVIAALIMVAFLRWELRTENPIVKISVFRNNYVFLFSNLAALINYSATFGVGFLLSLYLQYMKGYDPQTAGMVLVAQPIVQAVFSPLAGRLSDRVEPRVVASAGMGLCVMGLAQFAFLTPETSLETIFASLVFLGLGFALFSSPNTNAIMSSVDLRHGSSLHILRHLYIDVLEGLQQYWVSHEDACLNRLPHCRYDLGRAAVYSVLVQLDIDELCFDSLDRLPCDGTISQGLFEAF